MKLFNKNLLSMYMHGKEIMPLIDLILMISYQQQLLTEIIQTLHLTQFQLVELIMVLTQLNQQFSLLDGTVLVTNTQLIYLPMIIEIMVKLKSCITQGDMMLEKVLKLELKQFTIWEYLTETIKLLLKKLDLEKTKLYFQISLLLLWQKLPIM